jgi:hypothetical protein
VRTTDQRILFMASLVAEVVVNRSAGTSCLAYHWFVDVASVHMAMRWRARSIPVSVIGDRSRGAVGSRSVMLGRRLRTLSTPKGAFHRWDSRTIPHGSTHSTDRSGEDAGLRCIAMLNYSISQQLFFVSTGTEAMNKRIPSLERLGYSLPSLPGLRASRL